MFVMFVIMRRSRMGKIFVVGIGSGKKECMTLCAVKALEKSDIIIGYSTYINFIKEDFFGKEFISSPMKGEKQRCKDVVERAKSGSTVSIVSSGDAGIYGMAGLIFETAKNMNFNGDIEVIAGVTAASACAAALGAPLTHDFAVISLSDLLTPWSLIEKRIKLASEADFVICFYNPKSKGRSNYISEAEKIMLEIKHENTPVGIVKNAGRDNESVVICKLKGMSEKDIDMSSTVIVGNSQSFEFMGKIITPRGYKF